MMEQVKVRKGVTEEVRQEAREFMVGQGCCLLWLGAT